MEFSLIGVLPDATEYKPGIPQEPQTTLRVPIGSDVTIRVRVVTPGGAPVDLSGEGIEMRLTVKKKAVYSWPRILKIASIVSGQGVFEIVPDDTHDWQIGQYVYDVWLTKDGKRNAVIPLSAWMLLPAAGFLF